MSFVKSLKKEIKGSNIKFKILHTKYHLCWAWQRFWKGFDGRDLMDFGNSLNKRIVILLEEFLKINDKPMKIPYEITGSKDVILYYTMHQTEAIIETMIEYFKMANEDFVYEYYFGKKDVFLLKFEDYLRVENIRKQNQELAYEHLKMFIDNIWY